jgi:hypothetical protein
MTDDDKYVESMIKQIFVIVMVIIFLMIIG